MCLHLKNYIMHNHVYKNPVLKVCGIFWVLPGFCLALHCCIHVLVLVHE